MNPFQQFVKLIMSIEALNFDDYKPNDRNMKVVKFLRKSKNGTPGGLKAMTYEAQSKLCDDFLNQRFKKWEVVATVKSVERGTALTRPTLMHALEMCVQHGAVLLIGKVNRLARNISVFSSLMLTPLVMFFAELPFFDPRTASRLERSSLYRASLEAHLEGLRISERTLAVMPIVRHRKKKMGGSAHKAGSMANRKNAMNEAKRIKDKLVDYKKRHPDCSAPQIAAFLASKNIKTDQGTKFTDRRVRAHMKRLKIRIK